MLSAAQVEYVRELALLGYSYRRISRKAGVSRGSVASILNGTRCPKKSLVAGDRDWLWQRVPRLRMHNKASRCDGCGGTVFKPCILCWVRAVVAGKPHDANRSFR
jgi:hypothetical protein